MTDHIATIRGSYGALMHVVSTDNIKVGRMKQVPTYIADWCAQRDSNS